MVNLKSWDPAWERIFQTQEWGKYPPEELVRFIARTYYNVFDRKLIHILDVGCGTGAAIWYVAREGFSAYGIDGSKTAIEIAKKRFKDENLKCEFKIGDFINLDYPKEFFDCVIDICALQHNSPEKLRIVLSEIFRILKPGGKIFSKIISSKSKLLNGCDANKGYIHFFSKNEILSLFLKFKEINIETIKRTDKGNSFSYYIISAKK